MIHYACIVTQLSKLDLNNNKKIVKRSPCSIEQLNPTSTNGVFCNTQIVNHNTQGLNMVRVRPNYIDLLRLLAL